MPESEQQDKTLSEIVVKEAVGKGLDSPMRESILEAVEESDTSAQQRRLPLVGAVFGLGAALGFLVGQQSSDLEGSPLESLDEPEIIDDVTEQVEEATGAESEVLDEETAEDDAAGETDIDVDAESDGSSRLPKLLLAVGLVAGAIALRKRLGASGEDEEWEPIEEFEPATTADLDEDGDDGEDEMELEDDAEEAEASTDESDDE
ncbi:hypothetical protein G6M89_08570 [Natronolimnobius sp. AArcel1]|uniref:hypothetical protein n=1 Tax=Natronolimnobius sp. AArcel1 TaxID=1679093 RepID=UPI0013EA54C6|nr:hypothetical protein [Natronolimnobius sp. AArcel1]NGM69062.1 hypothetical protein [Natronolimnobius sp. AArcel1]